MNAGNILNTC